MVEALRICVKCGVERPLTFEHFDLLQSCNFRKTCRVCRRARSRELMNDDRTGNREKHRLRQAEWHAANPEYMKGYRKRNQDRLTEAEMRRRRDDPEYRAAHNASAKAYRDRNKEKILSNRVRTRPIGGLITPAQYDAMLEEQRGLCAVCQTDRKRNLAPGHKMRRTLCVDHDHITGEVRGLLCHHCNAGLGHFKDQPDLLARAIRYLKQHSPLTVEASCGGGFYRQRAT